MRFRVPVRARSCASSCASGWPPADGQRSERARRRSKTPPVDATTHTISQLAARFDVTPRTLRHYEDLGLLAPRRRGSSRLYDERDVSRLKLILRGKRLGFALEE